MEKIRYTVEMIKAVLGVLNRSRANAKYKCACAKTLHGRLQVICKIMENIEAMLDFRDILKDGKFKDELKEIDVKLNCTSYAYISKDSGLDVVLSKEIGSDGYKMVGGVLGEIRRVCRDIGKMVGDMESFIKRGKYECAENLYDKDLHASLDYMDKHCGFRLVGFLRRIENNEN